MQAACRARWMHPSLGNLEHSSQSSQTPLSGGHVRIRECQGRQKRSGICQVAGEIPARYRLPSASEPWHNGASSQILTAVSRPPRRSSGFRNRPMHDTDAELMRRANRDDPTAFAELVRRYQGALRRVAESRLGTVEAAEDVVQETFLAAYKSRHSYDDRFGFRTWLWTILLNQCRRYAGRQARARVRSRSRADRRPTRPRPSSWKEPRGRTAY